VPKPVTLSEAVQQYVDLRYATCAATTASNDASVLRRMVKAVGDIQVRHVTETHIERWFFSEEGLQKTVHEPSSFNNYRKRLVRFFRFCSMKGWLRTDPMIHIRARRVPSKERQRLDAGGLLRLLETTANPRDRAFLAVAINTGLRSNEIARIRVGDVDLDGGWLLANISKTAEQDTMPITSDLDAELRRWLLRYQSDLGCPLASEMHLLPAYSGDRWNYVEASDGGKVKVSVPGNWKPASPVTNPQQIVHRALRILGMPTKGEGLHTVRRSIARLYFDSMTDKGYDAALRATSALLHHKDAATTETYLGLTRERRHRDDTLRGQPFLTALVSDANVVPLRRSGT
jgi:integrase